MFFCKLASIPGLFKPIAKSVVLRDTLSDNTGTEGGHVLDFMVELDYVHRSLIFAFTTQKTKKKNIFL